MSRTERAPVILSVAKNLKKLAQGGCGTMRTMMVLTFKIEVIPAS
jgi:hypothetical protein